MGSLHCPLSKMARGPKKHLKRLAAPKSWMLDKLGGVFAPRPSTGPHKLRESLPMVVFLRNRLKYALNNSEVTKIVMQRLIKVDGKVRTDPNYPAGFMDVITIEKTGEFFRLIYDVKGRFAIHRITAEEAQYKLCKVKRVQVGPKGIPFITTHDGLPSATLTHWSRSMTPFSWTLLLARSRIHQVRVWKLGHDHRRTQFGASGYDHQP